MAKRYLSRPEVAKRIGVKPDTLNRYKLPEPDAIVGQLRGWLPETIDRWNESRPGPGKWGPEHRIDEPDEPAEVIAEQLRRAKQARKKVRAS